MIETLNIIFVFFINIIFGKIKKSDEPMKLIKKYVSRFLKDKDVLLESDSNSDYISGIVLTISTLFLTFASVFFTLLISKNIHRYIKNILDFYLFYQILNIGKMHFKTMQISTNLKKDNLDKAYIRVSNLINKRGTEKNIKEISFQTVRAIGENISPGIVAPIFYTTFLSTTFGVLFKASEIVFNETKKSKSFNKFPGYVYKAYIFIPNIISGLLIRISIVFLKYKNPSSYLKFENPILTLIFKSLNFSNDKNSLDSIYFANQIMLLVSALTLIICVFTRLLFQILFFNTLSLLTGK